MNKKLTTLLITTLTLLATSCTLPTQLTDSMTLACTNYANQHLTNKGLPPTATLDNTNAKIRGTATIPFTYTDHDANQHRATIDCTYKKGHATGTIKDTTYNKTPTKTPEGMTYHNSVDWLPQLQNSHSIFPGAEIKNLTHGYFCSAGYVVSNANNELYILTAGHCGKKGDTFGIREQTSDRYEIIGHMTDTRVRYQDDKETFIAGDDTGLIKITNPAWVSPTVPVAGTTFKGVMSAQKALDKGLTVCHLGRTTGFSCGPIIDTNNGNFRFWGLSDRGDSGGPIFAMDSDNNYWAVGVTSAVDDFAKTRPWGWEIEDFMRDTRMHIPQELHTSPQN